MARQVADAAEQSVPGGASVAQFPLVWGHPFPIFTENGVSFPGTGHWTNERYSTLAEWRGECADALKPILAGLEAHRLLLTRQALAVKAFKAARAKVGEHAPQVKITQIADQLLPHTILTWDEGQFIEELIAKAEIARQHLVTLSQRSKARIETVADLLLWTLRQPDLLLRLSINGFIPRPPASIIPASMPVRGPSRQAKLDAKPTADTAEEDIF